MHYDTTSEIVGPFFILPRTDVSIFARKIVLLYSPFSYKSTFGLNAEEEKNHWKTNL